jgi:hypothetical protein
VRARQNRPTMKSYEHPGGRRKVVQGGLHISVVFQVNTAQVPPYTTWGKAQQPIPRPLVNLFPAEGRWDKNPVQRKQRPAVLEFHRVCGGAPGLKLWASWEETLNPWVGWKDQLSLGRALLKAGQHWVS